MENRGQSSLPRVDFDREIMLRNVPELRVGGRTYRYGELVSVRNKVLILGYGGTIAMVPDEQGVLKPAKSIEEMVEMVPTLKDMAEVDLVQLENKDSTNITPKHWKRLTRRIEDQLRKREYQGIIVTHGTDTLAYTAGAVALALGRGLKIPIVFTGSQKPLVEPGTDARSNLENAMQTVIQAEKEGIAEVMITFADKVLRAARAIKISESKFQAFESPAYPPLATIDATGVHFASHALTRTGYPLEVKPEFNRHVVTLDLVPGLNPNIVKSIIRSENCRGLLLKSLGAGNVPSEGAYSLLPVIQEATTKYNIPVLVATKFVGGITHMEMYEPGKKALDMGAIPTGDMTDVMSQVKLMWLLRTQTNLGRHKRQRSGGFHNEIDLDKIRSLVSTNYVGEITE
jgi:L-asparaginase